ncbi:MAG TPA: ABC transporter permease, partial [Vicinamibacterales bacterium]|nr:ABC transporter permease [Vicinamibacterales bacterium]
MAFLWHDIRDAARALLRTGGYSLVVALTLGLGIGVNTAIFTVVDALILRPLPYADPEQLVRVAEWPRTGGNYTVSPAAYLHWRDRVQAFTRFEARRGAVFTILDGGDAEEMRGARVTSGYFDLFGVRPLYGRTFSTDDAQPGAACTTVVSHRVWLNRLGGDASVIATPVRFSGRTCTLIGVLPPGTTFDRGPIDVYVPLAFTAADTANNGRMLTVLARLRPERSIDAARDEMVALASAFNATRGEAGRGWTASVTPLHDVVVGADSRWLAGVLFGAVSVVLAVACLNVAGLALSRTVVRRREIAIRTALGAGRWRVFRYLLVESLLLALAGGLVGVLMGSWGLRVLVSLVPAGLLPPETPPLLDARALLFTGFLALLTGLFFGTVPAWRGTAPNPAEALAAGGRSAGSSSVTTRAHSALLVVEVALAMVLVVAGVSLAVSFVRLTRVEPGFSAEHVLTFRVALGGERYQSGDASARFF